MLSKSKIIRNDFGGLNKLVKAMDEKFVIRVGIMGAKNQAHKSDDGGNITNAELGAIHEFGSFTRKIPARSFLRMPIYKGASFIIQKFNTEVRKMAKGGSLLPLVTKIAIRCEQMVQRAFASRGFGQWAPITKSTREAKGSSAILIDTGQLRRSISSRVIKQ